MDTNKKLSDDDVERLSEVFKLFGSEPRLRILLRLKDGECMAGELAESADISQSAASHQLKELRLGRIIRSRKDGLNVLYRLSDSHIVDMLENGLEHFLGEHCDE